ncbi:hypothetical protein KP509_18G037500 [Ceratopteris richardii]|nr:hypothetical protein KP509_18G037500 [Ceratopteris richardii]
MVPVIGPLPGFPPSGLIPISYNVPQNLPLSRGAASTSFSEPVDRAVPAEAQDPAAVGHQPGGVNIPAGVLQPGQIHLADGQRHIVRRFHVAVQIDLLLILKLAAVVFIFSQDGSKDRLFLLLFLAVLAYLYQTGALSPILRWISQSAQRAMMPPQQQQAPARPAPVRPGPAERRLGQAANAPGDAPAEVEPDAVDNAAAPLGGDGGDPPDVAGDNVQQQPPEAQRARWWGFLKEVQMLVVGFVTSLLPGFHQHMD